MSTRSNFKMSSKNQKGSTTIILLIVMLIFIYFSAFSCSRRGWGYPGYYGYRYGPSLWYWGRPHTYHGPSVRSGSVDGPRHRGGGLGGGK